MLPARQHFTPSQEKKCWLGAGLFHYPIIINIRFSNIFFFCEEPKGSVMVLRTYCAESTERNELSV